MLGADVLPDAGRGILLREDHTAKNAPSNVCAPQETLFNVSASSAKVVKALFIAEDGRFYRINIAVITCCL